MDETLDTSVQDNTNTEGEVVETSTDEATETTEEVSGAPESYADFTVPEGFEQPFDDFKAWAKEQNMTQAQAQSAVDLYASKIVPQIQQAQEKVIEGWREQSVKEFGDKGIELANKAVTKFATPEFIEFLSTSGLGNHPEMIRVFKEIAGKISESSLVTPKANVTAKKEVQFPGLE